MFMFITFNSLVLYIVITCLYCGRKGVLYPFVDLLFVEGYYTLDMSCYVSCTSLIHVAHFTISETLINPTLLCINGTLRCT